MSASPNGYEDETTERLELRALERMVGALCADIERLTHEAASRDALGSREADLQSQAFTERREQAVELLETPAAEPYEIRVTRLEKMVEALSRSREFFLGVV